jgi:hypothetical protein
LSQSVYSWEATLLNACLRFAVADIYENSEPLVVYMQMKPRRNFLRLAAAASAAGASAAFAGRPVDVIDRLATFLESTGVSDRAYWCDIAVRLATPLLDALARRRFKTEMPVEMHPGIVDRVNYTHLEAFSRLLCGLAPWLELGASSAAETQLRNRYVDLALVAMDAATDPKSPDLMNFSSGSQPLVDAAFLAQAMLRAPSQLWKNLESRVKTNIIAALKSSRVIKPGENNWKLFATMVEAFLHRVGEQRDDMRLFDGIRKHRDWYVGDGVYGDGPEFHWDYYNSFVIQPMLIEALDIVGDEAEEWQILRDQSRRRLARWAEIQERLIAPDGSYPAIGRSLSYRCGAFQGLALAALRHLLPESIEPGQARRALTLVIRRTMEAPGTWDTNGWLRIGLAGHQPALGEPYISSGSLYLCSTALLPLGLPSTDSFWIAPATHTTAEKAWGGVNISTDHALRAARPS